MKTAARANRGPNGASFAFFLPTLPTVGTSIRFFTTLGLTAAFVATESQLEIPSLTDQ